MKKIIWSESEKAEIIAAHRRGEYLSHIARRHCVTGPTVRKLLVASGESVIFDRPRRLYSVNESFFDVIDTEEKAYWLGFLCAETYIGQNNDLELTLAGIDAQHVEKFRASLGSAHPLVNKIGGSGGPALGIHIGSCKLVDSLAQHGVTRGGLTRKPPESLAEHLRRHYFRGLFDGDGGFCIGYPNGRNNKPNVSLTVCGSLSCVEGFAAFSRDICGTQSRISPHRSGIYYFTCGGNRQAKKLAAALYDDSNVALDRKVATWGWVRQLPDAPMPMRLTLAGTTMSLAEWASALKITSAALYRRVRLGWSDEQILSTPFVRRSPRRSVLLSPA